MKCQRMMPWQAKKKRKEPRSLKRKRQTGKKTKFVSIIFLVANKHKIFKDKIKWNWEYIIYHSNMLRSIMSHVSFRSLGDKRTGQIWYTCVKINRSLSYVWSSDCQAFMITERYLHTSVGTYIGKDQRFSDLMSPFRSYSKKSSRIS